MEKDPPWAFLDSDPADDQLLELNHWFDCHSQSKNAS